LRPEERVHAKTSQREEVVCFLEMKDKAAETLRKAAQAKPGERD
jgi:hypothetical protein